MAKNASDVETDIIQNIMDLYDCKEHTAGLVVALVIDLFGVGIDPASLIELLRNHMALDSIGFDVKWLKQHYEDNRDDKNR